MLGSVLIRAQRYCISMKYANFYGSWRVFIAVVGVFLLWKLAKRCAVFTLFVKQSICALKRLNRSKHLKESAFEGCLILQNEL